MNIGSDGSVLDLDIGKAEEEEHHESEPIEAGVENYGVFDTAGVFIDTCEDDTDDDQRDKGK